MSNLKALGLLAALVSCATPSFGHPPAWDPSFFDTVCAPFKQLFNR